MADMTLLQLLDRAIESTRADGWIDIPIDLEHVREAFVDLLAFANAYVELFNGDSEIDYALLAQAKAAIAKAKEGHQR